MPCIPLTAGPTWDFSTDGFQAFATQEMEAEITGLYRKYRSKYHSSILPNDFQHALFCLAGLMKMKLISFVLEGQNNPKFFIPNGVTPPLPPRLLKPRRTSGDWTVDCFIARFGKFEMMFRSDYERWPNPILWLEAEMDREEIRGQGTKPYRLVVEKGEKELRDPPVIDWVTRGNFSQYPKPMTLTKPQPLELHDIVSPDTFRFKESKRAKKDRKEKEKATKRSVTVDLTGDASSGHMNGPAVCGARARHFDDLGSGYTGDESDLASPIHRKRKYNGSSGSRFTHRVDSDGDGFSIIEQLQHLHRAKQEKNPDIVLEDDLYSTPPGSFVSLPLAPWQPLYRCLGTL